MWVSKIARAAAHQNLSASTRHVGRTALLVFMAVILAVGSAAATAYVDLQGNIAQTNVDDLLGTDRPSAATTNPDDPNAGQALSILVLGSDVRSGSSDIDGSGASGDVTGMRADTTMLFHISADRSRVDVVSIPRDTLVDIPSCTVWNNEDGTDSSESAAQTSAMFNSAFATGGAGGQVASAAACAMKTVEQLTGIRLDGYIVVDFNAFTEIVNALGGIPMYFDEDLTDTYAGLDVSAGCRLLDGDQALALARARKQIGDGSDISRIGRQQELVTAMLKEVLNLNLFTDLPSLYTVLDAATQSISTSKGLGDITTLAGLASSLRNINLDSVQFITMPWAYAGNRVSVAADADILWNAIANDHVITATTDDYGNVSIVDQTLADEAAAASPSTSSAATDSATTTPSATATSDTATSPASSEATTTAPVCTKENAN